MAIEPSYNGFFIFGEAAVVRANVVPPARTWHVFPRLDGRLTKYMGNRGACADASGVLSGVTLDDLAFAEGVFDQYMLEGRGHVLVDTSFTTWPNMILVSWEKIGEIMWDWDGFSREYRARFESTKLTP